MYNLLRVYPLKFVYFVNGLYTSIGVYLYQGQGQQKLTQHIKREELQCVSQNQS